ncbi:ethylene-responsive transcription factor ERF012-like [Typha latifolia]|uniref:ethylene-responsive transcription factor ERF012-like n=1 Tax=Typha latifolia TaxID=4733 RepID=UPI003C2BE374
MKADGGATSSCTAAAAAEEKKYKGVRQRKWGRWVSEIRLPNSRDRIWLGSYDTPEKAARAFDAAFVCLRGHLAGQLNFPDSPPPRIPGGGGPELCPQQIQAVAANHANRTRPGEPAATPSVEDSAVMSPSEVASDGRTEESGDAFDWSLFDTLLSPARGCGAEFQPVIEDFPCDFLSPVPGPTAEAEAADESSLSE